MKKEPKNGESGRKTLSAGRSMRAPLTAPGGQLSARKVSEKQNSRQETDISVEGWGKEYGREEPF